jgi:hypothetical protein
MADIARWRGHRLRSGSAHGFAGCLRRPATRLMDEGGAMLWGRLPNTRRLELVSAKPLRNGAVALHYRRER